MRLTKRKSRFQKRISFSLVNAPFWKQSTHQQRFHWKWPFLRAMQLLRQTMQETLTMRARSASRRRVRSNNPPVSGFSAKSRFRTRWKFSSWASYFLIGHLLTSIRVPPRCHMISWDLLTPNFTNRRERRVRLTTPMSPLRSKTLQNFARCLHSLSVGSFTMRWRETLCEYYAILVQLFFIIPSPATS